MLAVVLDTFDETNIEVTSHAATLLTSLIIMDFMVVRMLS